MEAVRPVYVVEVSYDHVSGGRFRHGTKDRPMASRHEPSRCRREQLRQTGSDTRLTRHRKPARGRASNGRGGLVPESSRGGRDQGSRARARLRSRSASRTRAVVNCRLVGLAVERKWVAADADTNCSSRDRLGIYEFCATIPTKSRFARCSKMDERFTGHCRKEARRRSEP